MSELLLKVDDGGGFEDGDVLNAFNDHTIKLCHAQHICSPWVALRNSDGYLVGGTHVEEYYKEVYQYRIVRTSATRATRTELATGTTVEMKGPEFQISVNGATPSVVTFEEVVDMRQKLKHAGNYDFDNLHKLWRYSDLGIAVIVATTGSERNLSANPGNPPSLILNGVGTPYTAINLNPDPIDIPLWMVRRRHQRGRDGKIKRAIFGSIGSEVWYDGKIDYSARALNRIWRGIETHTPERKSHQKYRRLAFSDQELKSHLVIPVDDFNEARRKELESPLFEDDNELRIIKKRKNFYRWREMLGDLGVSESEVRDKGRKIDVRDRPRQRPDGTKGGQKRRPNKPGGGRPGGGRNRQRGR